MSRKTFHLIFALILLLNLLWLPTGRASADIGPKPELDFYFSLPRDLSIEEAALRLCQDDACLEVEPYFWGAELDCKQNHCSTMIFSPGHTYQLQVLFSDGSTRLSDPFPNDQHRSTYTVQVQETALVVHRQSLFSTNAGDFYFMLLIPFAIAGSALLAIVAGVTNAIAKRIRPEQQPGKKSIGLYILGIGLCAIALAIGSYATLALPVNLLIELTVAALYMGFYWTRKKPRSEGTGEAAVVRPYTTENRPPWLHLLGAVVVVNLISQPLLWIAVNMASMFWGIPLFGATLLLEVGVWFLEALLLYNLNKQHLSLHDARELSLFMNLISFGIGLFLAL